MVVKISGNSSPTAPSFAGDDGDSGLHAAADQVQLVTNSTVAMTVDSSQRVGIGTETPTGFIHIQGTSTGTETYGRFTTGSAGGDQSLVIKSGSSRDHMAIQVSTNSGTADDLALQPDGGSVGIGTTTPSTALHLKANSPYVTFEDDNDNQDWEIRGTSRFALYDVTNSAERLAVDSSGRLLVGTSSHSGIGGASGRIEVIGAINLRTTDTSVVNGDAVGILRFIGDDSSVTQGAEIAAYGDGTWTGGSSAPTRLTFSTTANGQSSPTERMRIRADTSSIYATAYVEVNSNRTSGALILFKVTSGATAVETGNDRFYVFGNGDCKNSTGVFTTISSDERLKQDIVDVGSQWDDIKGISLKKFRYKDNPEGELQLGVIAQELQQVCPGLVTTQIATAKEVEASGGAVTEGEEVYGWKQSILFLKAVKALQEAQLRIETLETQNAEQATTIASFEARISALEGGN